MAVLRPHLALTVTDVERAIPFYEALFGANPRSAVPATRSSPSLSRRSTSRSHRARAPSSARSTTPASRSRRPRTCSPPRSASSRPASPLSTRWTRPAATRARTRSGSATQTERRGRSSPLTRTRTSTAPVAWPWPRPRRGEAADASAPARPGAAARSRRAARVERAAGPHPRPRPSARCLNGPRSPAGSRGSAGGVRARVLRRRRGRRRGIRPRRTRAARAGGRLRPGDHGVRLRDGHLSGAHINPAVTIAFTVTRHFPRGEALTYIVAQLTGAALAGLVLLAIWPDKPGDLGANPISVGAGSAVVVEAILSALLMFVIMAVATDTRAVGAAAAIAIGGVVLLDISSAAASPARA